MAKLIEEDFIKELNQAESMNRITSFGFNIEKKVAQIHPALQKYTDQKITFLNQYLKKLQMIHKKDESSQAMNVREKLGQIHPKSVKEYIQVMTKLFNFYAVKKVDKTDISKENVKLKFSQRSFRKPEANEENLEELYNFKLPKQSQVLIDLKKKKEKVIDIDEINVDEFVSMKKRKIDWLKIRKNKKNYHSIKIENDNSISLSRNLYCE